MGAFITQIKEQRVVWRSVEKRQLWFAGSAVHEMLWWAGGVVIPQENWQNN